MYPFLYPFGNEERWLSYLRSCLNWNRGEIERASILLKRNLIPVVHGPELGTFLGVSPKLVAHMAMKPEQYYRSFKIKKKNGKFREITAPRVFLKTIQRYVLDCILSALSVHYSAVGFRKALSAKDGAKRHIGHKFIWNIDLKDFFPAITKGLVRELFLSKGFTKECSYFLSGLCCLGERLPQGAPTSPAISNLIFYETDEKISAVTHTSSITYTRYADDLSFSSESPIPLAFQKKVTRIIVSSGFKINHDKTRLMGPGCRREITGLTVNEKVSIPRPTRRKLRARFHQASLEPKNFVKDKQVLLGYAHWVSEHHPAEGNRFHEIALAIPSDK